MANARTPEIDKLYDEVLSYRRTTDFKELLEFVAKFRHVAPYNAMLIHIQKPGSSYVASAADWYSRFERTVKAGARPLLILRPFGPVAFVFEYNDTEGKPLPDDLVRPFKTNSPVSEAQLNRLIKGACYDGIDVVQQEYGTSRAGQIEYSPHPSTIRLQYKEKLYSLQSNYSIVLNRNLSVPEQFTTMLHELGHFYCGHLNYGNMKWLPSRPGLETSVVEFEAETACWLVCQRLGIESASAGYLHGYLEDNEFIPEVSVDSILRSAGMIETILQGAIKPRKDLILKEAAENTQQTLFDTADGKQN